MTARSRNHARCLLVWASLTALMLSAQTLALAELLSAATTLDRRPLVTQRFEHLLVWLCSALLFGCCIWWWLCSSLVVLDAARGRIGTRSRGCPALLRRWVLVACGVAVVGSVAAAPADAHPVADPLRPHPGAEFGSAADRDRLQRHAIAGLPLPERVGIGHVVGRRLAPEDGPGAAAPATVKVGAHERFTTVRPGDSLWLITARTLGPDARPDAIESSWRSLYEINRDVVGPDPDLIHPGLRLRLPGGGRE